MQRMNVLIAMQPYQSQQKVKFKSWMIILYKDIDSEMTKFPHGKITDTEDSVSDFFHIR